MSELRPGTVLLIDGRASVQFGGNRALRLRLVAVDDKPTYPGWVWLTGYVLDQRGVATARREVYVQRAGLRIVSAAAPAAVVRTRPRRAPAARVMA
ncbi:hypothetical protein ABZ793_34030 [Micromonospora sp. NPDC047465]|uniref:hypothetical protein n=1 Tax=Micromonospora sp. NPDC047465 TaxID=3154813 RepID=UPI0033E9EB4F